MLPPLAGFQVTLNGRFWVTAEGVSRLGWMRETELGRKQRTNDPIANPQGFFIYLLHQNPEAASSQIG